jgi:Predicted enzyme with a TIM-barrel fold
MTPQLTDKYMVTIAERLTSAYARIAKGAQNAQRNSNDIKEDAVSKTKPDCDIMADI